MKYLSLVFVFLSVISCTQESKKIQELQTQID